MKRIIDVDEKLVCEGFVRNFTKEERDILVSAIRNSTPYEEKPQGDLISREYVEGIVEELENICQNAPVHVLELLSNIKNAPTIEVLKNEPKFLIDENGKITPLTPQDGWIPIITRPLTEEEKEEYPDATFMYDCHMPDDGEEVFVSTKWGVSTDTYCAEPDGCYFEEYCDEGDVLAWQPFPKPYKEGEHGRG